MKHTIHIINTYPFTTITAHPITIHLNIGTVLLTSYNKHNTTK